MAAIEETSYDVKTPLSMMHFHCGQFHMYSLGSKVVKLIGGMYVLIE